MLLRQQDEQEHRAEAGFILTQNQRQTVFLQKTSHPSSPKFYTSFNTPLNSTPGL